MRARLGVLATVVNAVLTLAPQLVALVTLAPADFGRFSIVYLLFAWGASLQLSIVCEPVVRSGDSRAALGGDFRAAASWLAIAMGVLASTVGLFVWEVRLLTALSALAVIAWSFRIASRYGALVCGDWRGVLVTDLVGAALFAAAFAVTAHVGVSDAVVLLTAWAAAGVGVVIFGPAPVLASPRALVRWTRQRRTEIAPLLKDSLVLDASSIGTPYLLAPLLGFASFGVYRGLSNVAAPVRLLIEPLRPAWATLRPARLQQVLRTISLSVAVPLGLATAMALEIVGRLPWTLGVLTELADWAVAAGAFVALSMVSHLYYISARLHAPAAELWRGRCLQSGAAVVLPLAGAWWGGLEGAIWSFVGATALGAVVWVVQAGRGRHCDHSR